MQVLVRSAIGEPIPGSKVGLKAKTVSENGGIKPVEFAGRDSQQRLCDELGLADFYVDVPRLTKELHLEVRVFSFLKSSITCTSAVESRR